MILAIAKVFGGKSKSNVTNITSAAEAQAQIDNLFKGFKG
jgi:hypothetical protein